MSVERDTPITLKPVERRAFERQLIDATSGIFLANPNALDGSILPQDVQHVATVLREGDYHATAALGAFLLTVIAEDNCAQRVSQLSTYSSKPRNDARSQRQVVLREIGRQRAIIGESIFGESVTSATNRARELFAPSQIDRATEAAREDNQRQRSAFVNQIRQRFPGSAEPHRSAL